MAEGRAGAGRVNKWRGRSPSVGLEKWRVVVSCVAGGCNPAPGLL